MRPMPNIGLLRQRFCLYQVRAERPSMRGLRAPRRGLPCSPDYPSHSASRRDPEVSPAGTDGLSAPPVRSATLASAARGGRDRIFLLPGRPNHYACPVSGANSLTDATARMRAAVSRQDAGALRTAYDELRKAVIEASEAERAAAAGGLVPALEGMPVRYGGSLAQMTGAMVGMAGDPAPVLDVLARRACGVMEDAIVFARAWRC